MTRKSFTLQVIQVRGVRVEVWQITSPDIPGLLVQAGSLADVLRDVPAAIDRVEGMSDAARLEYRRLVVRAHADAARKG